MKIYGVRASEWESDYNCFCVNMEIARREKQRLINEYNSDEDISDCIDIEEFDLIEK